MVEVAAEGGKPSHLIETPADIRPEWLRGVCDLGLSSSASAPEHLVTASVRHLRTLVNGLVVRELGHPEEMSFKLPATVLELRDKRLPAVRYSSQAVPQSPESGGPR
jgi:4-hydroxy-3-methylbut-2-enyl diphosphate reductase